jgi:hypothetical protein
MYRVSVKYYGLTEKSVSEYLSLFGATQAAQLQLAGRTVKSVKIRKVQDDER